MNIPNLGENEGHVYFMDDFALIIRVCFVVGISNDRKYIYINVKYKQMILFQCIIINT